MRVLLLCLVSLPAWSAIDVYQFDNSQQEDRFHRLTEELRCPKCQNQSISASDADIAKDMRARVHRMILEGKSDDEIVGYFVDRYGNFVTYRPPVNRGTLILWLGPLLLFVGGALVIILLLKRASGRADTDEGDDQP
ncbi:cytochrome C biogenesis protein [Alcanivorax hongdengensis A-11-3]|uniref:Cytochrome c-type biogenesis protein n=1 Tax=Alcanivorax hongdengensis A-11-3 TaxID=1177179 RepID=L0WDR3_9GAMM|nr:cytochrome C biogenesis protein [Alcanivorax hongdengensis A-11-3]